MSSKYTIKITDTQSLLDQETKNLISKNADAVCTYIAGYVEWNGCLDLEVRILPDSESWSSANGLLPALGSISWNGSGWTNNTLNEALSGIDPLPDEADIGCYMFLGEDGFPRNYGAPIWFDPNPSSSAETAVPPGYHDFYGILVHEVFHCLGFYGATIEYQRHVKQVEGFYYFAGPKTVRLLGAPLPLAPSYSDGTVADHYGNDQNPASTLKSGLLYQWGNYEKNRLEIGQVDLAVLEDLGYKIKTYDGLAVFEEIDSQKIAPQVTISTNLGHIIEGKVATIGFELSKPSTNFTVSDVVVSGGSLSNFSGSGMTYTATFTPTANSTSPGVISIASGVFTDAAGNANADGSDSDNRVTITVDTRVNSAPTSSSLSSTTREDTALVFTSGQFKFTDSNSGDSLKSVMITALPVAGSLSLGGSAVSEGQEITVADLSAGKLVYTPQTNQTTTASFQFKASDGKDYSSASYLAYVSITAVNDSPVVSAAIADQTATEGTQFSFAVPQGSFTDVDAGDSLTYKATLAGGKALPKWLTFDAATQIFSGTPADADGGQTHQVTVTATDKSKASISDTFALAVEGVNVAPTAKPITTRPMATEGKSFSFSLPKGTFTDGDKGDVLTYGPGAIGLPDWLSIDAKTGKLTGKPDYRAGDSFEWVLSIKATDKGGLSANTDLTIFMTNIKTVKGTAGNDTLITGRGSDNLSGLAGNDSLVGGEAVDEYGTDQDTLSGGLGNDTLTGGGGADRFVFDAALNALTNLDQITDFVSGEDSIALKGSVFIKLRGDKDLSDNLWIYGQGTQDTNDYLIWNAQTSTVSYDADGVGAKSVPIAFVSLTGISALLPEDLLMVA